MQSSNLNFTINIYKLTNFPIYPIFEAKLRNKKINVIFSLNFNSNILIHDADNDYTKYALYIRYVIYTKIIFRKKNLHPLHRNILFQLSREGGIRWRDEIKFLLSEFTRFFSVSVSDKRDFT